MRIISERNRGAGKVIMLALKLRGIQALERLIIDATDRVAVRKHQVAFAVRVSPQNCSFTEAPGPEQPRAPRDFRIFFGTTEAGQERHGSYRPPE